MAIIEESPLFDLIKNLSKGEKRSFRQLANYSSDSDKKYLVLFDLIEAQKNYNEEKIRKKLLELKIKTPLPVLKNYVQELLMRVLRFHHSDRSIDTILRSHLHDAEILHNKGLDKLRDRSLRKAKMISKKHEKKEALLEILNKEWNYKSIFNPKIIEQDHEKAVDDLSKLLFARKMVYNVSLLLEKGEIRDDSLRREWDEVIQHPMMLGERTYSGYEENCHFHHNWMRYYHRINDFAKCCYHQEQLISHMESKPELLTQHLILYIFELNGLVVAYCQNKDYHNAQKVIDKLIILNSPSLNAPEKTTLLNTISIAYGNLIHGFYLSDFDAAIKASEQAELYIRSLETNHHHAAFLYLNLAKTLIYTGRYKEALRWTNTILNESPDNRRDDFYVLAWMFNLIIHYEMDHIDLLPSLIRSTTRFLRKRKRLYKTENAILTFLHRKLPETNSQKEVLQFFKELKSELDEIIKDPYEAKAFKYFDFIAWLESKIEKKAISEVVKAKING